MTATVIFGTPTMQPKILLWTSSTYSNSHLLTFWHLLTVILVSSTLPPTLCCSNTAVYSDFPFVLITAMDVYNNGEGNSSSEEEQRLLLSPSESYSTAPELDPPPSPDNNGSDNTNQQVGSLDFERIVNEYSIQAIRDQWLSSDGARQQQKRRLLGYTGRTATRWVLSAFAGLVTGLISIMIVSITGRLITWRSQTLQDWIMDPTYSDSLVFWIYAFLNLVGALSASWLCVALAPQAAGSGIAQVKAYLNGIRLTNRLNSPRLPVLLMVKIVGTILSVSSGLTTGMEGPLIYIGAIVGAGCTKVSAFASKHLVKWQHCTESCCGGRRLSGARTSCTQRWLAWTTTELSHFATDGERRDLVSIGASCGFAASFGAPIGGLLFVLDDISSYFNQSLLLRMLVANTIGTFCLAIQHGDLSNFSVINLGTYDTANDDIFFTRFKEVPLYILVGVFGGILGGFFCKSFMWLRTNITNKLPPRGQGRGQWQLLQVALLSLLTSLLLFYLPSMKWACKDRHEATVVLDTDFSEKAEQVQDSDQTHREHFFCPPGQVNELGNILFGSRIDGIKRVLTDPTDFMRETLLTVGILFYILMTLTFGVALPSGIFTPAVLIGASLGGAAGITFKEWFGDEVAPSTFALLGVAALLAGIQRSTVSLCVILVEGTGQIKVLMPSIIVVVVARYVASLIYDKGIFEAVMASKHFPYLDQKENKRRYDAIQVSEIMSNPPVVTVHPYERASDLVDLLENSMHSGFPVVDPTTKKLLGLVRRDQIAALLECGIFDKGMNEAKEVSVNTRRPARRTRPRSGVANAPLMQWAYHINDDRYDYVLDTTPRGHHIRKEVVADDLTVKIAPRYSVVSSPKLQSTRFTSLPTEFATVGQNEKGLLVVSWLNPIFGRYVVNLGVVMNLGAYCVRKCCHNNGTVFHVMATFHESLILLLLSCFLSLSHAADYMPVSKAYALFTSLGLRHIVVLGGESGGQVVGILSRANLLPNNIFNETGL